MKRAFSRQHVEGVWLTAFDIAAGGSDLTIAGRAVSADLIPAYLQRLNKEAPMQGRQFASVTIHQAAMREAVMQRGVRADEASPGTGFGLAIVRDLAELYGGSIALGVSPLGGLQASLRLPSTSS